MTPRRVEKWQRHVFAATLAAMLAGFAGIANAAQPALRVCADPNNLPYSNDRLEGFENKLAQIIADDLQRTVSYTWHAQRRGFIRETLNAHRCDVVMGVPNLDMLRVTRPYYRSSYVFVSRQDAGINADSMDPQALKPLRIGVHLIGDDGANTPPADVLGEEGLVQNIRGYPIYGDYRNEAPPFALLDAVAKGDVDIAAVWGPLAGYYALHSPVPLKIVPIKGTEAFLPRVFQFSVSMGVRHTDLALKAELDEAILRNKEKIDALLDAYGVPRI